ncbi:Ubiquitin carboxyl-terminal hydrolase [Ceratobasidium theobromae]|uniref:ubiquitinyl hydrolase 1 n=1 Tax=Ceratobasidium theobromae TaxID=1582974 RepID=A0A5N5QTR5_9AGAM|nr:Ubiquitin carboxyl-terminal hydrolase [Ceratobasidium theobromae]
MSALTVHIKHGGKQQSLQLDPDQPPSAFKQVIYQTTGVPVDRMKVMIKGTLLKDDNSWGGVNPKAGQVFTVIGTASELPKPPSTPVQFLEDMDERELASALKMPVGLGNTCYMNSTIQALRAIPELHTALDPVSNTPTNAQHRLALALRDTYKSMGKTTEGFMPVNLLMNLRSLFPQFAEQSPSGLYAQQDAEECWSQVVNAIKGPVPGLDGASGSAARTFVEQYMLGEMRTVLKSMEDPDEPEKVTTEGMLKINCNISNATNYMHSGIKESLDEVVEKQSERLGRVANYQRSSRISRLPSNLTVHMVRFYWRRDINKKAKIMRKVKFPFEFDALELLTDELRAKLQPATRKLREIEGDRLERRRARRKLKNSNTQAAGGPVAAEGASGVNAEPEAMAVDEQHPGDIEDEATAREREKAAMDEVIDPEIRADTGAAVHALFDLAAIVTHKGASADGGHYIGWVRKSALEELDESAPEGDKEEWYKFDDDKVTIVIREKISTLDGGGEDSTAYLLLYRLAYFAVAALLSASSLARAVPQSGISEARYDFVDHNQQLAFVSASATYSKYTIDFIDSVLASFANDYLQAHNSFRAQHGAQPLTWSPALAVKAQNWANGCVFKHGSTGENLAAGTGNYGPLDAVKGWTDEMSQTEDYDSRNPKPSHFTQVVWKSTTQLGCAVKECPPGSIFPAKFGVARYHVCEYAPPGNVLGQFPANVQK